MDTEATHGLLHFGLAAFKDLHVPERNWHGNARSATKLRRKARDSRGERCEEATAVLGNRGLGPANA